MSEQYNKVDESNIGNPWATELGDHVVSDLVDLNKTQGLEVDYRDLGKRYRRAIAAAELLDTVDGLDDDQKLRQMAVLRVEYIEDGDRVYSLGRSLDSESVAEREELLTRMAVTAEAINVFESMKQYVGSGESKELTISLASNALANDAKGILEMIEGGEQDPVPFIQPSQAQKKIEFIKPPEVGDEQVSDAESMEASAKLSDIVDETLLRHADHVIVRDDGARA